MSSRSTRLAMGPSAGSTGSGMNLELTEPEQAASRRETAEQVADMLAGLTAKQREAVRLYWLEERSLRDAAAAAGCAAEAFKKRLSLARKRLLAAQCTMRP